MIKLGGGETQRLEIDGSVFLYKEMNGEVEANIQDDIVKVTHRGKMNWKPGQLFLRTLEQGIVGWENVLNDSDEPIEFKKELIKFIPKHVRDKLYDLISPAKLSGEEEKN